MSFPFLKMLSALNWAASAFARMCMAVFLVIYVAAAAASGNANAQNENPKPPDVPMSWEAWVKALWPEARDAGISQATFNGIFSKLQPDCKQPGVYCSGSQPSGDAFADFKSKGLPQSCYKVTQTEFLRPAKYFPQKYMHKLAMQGRALLESWKTKQPDIYRHLMEIEARYKVDHKLLIALWGRETSFGKGNTLNYNAIRALASMAYATAPSRREWAKGQLLAALKMVDRGFIRYEDFKSSYAGATGLTQIMPDEFMNYGADGDGDGRIDIWNSIPDALATTANTLKHYGWDGDQLTWGYEIQVPKRGKFDCTLEGRSNRRPIHQWIREFGMSRASAGNPAFPRPDNPGYLVMPAGARGPAFLATDNFEVLRHYNTSDVYALFIGNVTDRIACETEDGMCPFAGQWPVEGQGDDFPFSVEHLCKLQIALKAKGFSQAEPDGLFGLQTRLAIGRYQKSLNQQPDCYPTMAIYKALTGDGAAAGPVATGATSEKKPN